MSWWGKVIGGAFGFILVGPLGALLGAAIGHSFDKGLKELENYSGFAVESAADKERIQAAFFTAIFSIMGQIAKADGRVSETEIEVARRTMAQMQLTETQTQAAINLFNQGKAADFDFESVIEQFHRECGRRTNLLRIFMEILLATALADDHLDQAEQRLLQRVAELLGFHRRQFEELLAMATAQKRFSQFDNFETPSKPAVKAIEQAYKLLGVAPESSDEDVKKVYRKLMNQHHPDKLVSKGLPEEMMKIATEKTREIKDAYELIKQYRAQNS